MKQKLKDDLRTLTGLISVSCSEQEVIKELGPRLDACSDSVELTGTGALIARKKGIGDGPVVMVTAHMDEIGFAVKSITPTGFLKIEKIGFFSDKMIPSRKVWVQTRTGRIPGVTGMRAAHLLTPEEASRVESADKAYIDIGVNTAEEAEELGVYIGSKVVIQSDFMELANPDIICTRAVDNRIGCAILLNLMGSLTPRDFKGELVGAFSVMEEVTCSGTVPLYNYVKPDYAIVLDTVPCGDVPDVNTAAELPVYLGKGPVMIVTQGSAGMVRYSNVHPFLRRLIGKASAAVDIPVRELALSDKAYITEESLAFMSGKGTPAATLAIPRRYSHTPNEVLDINDADMTLRLLKEIIKENGAEELSFLAEF